MAVTVEGGGVTLGAVSQRAERTVSSRTAIMEIVWSGLIEAINHHLQAPPPQPPRQHSSQLHAHTLIPKLNYSFCVVSPGSTGSTCPPNALIYNNCGASVWEWLQWHVGIKTSKVRTKKINFLTLYKSTEMVHNTLYLFSLAGPLILSGPETI